MVWGPNSMIAVFLNPLALFKPGLCCDVVRLVSERLPKPNALSPNQSLLTPKLQILCFQNLKTTLNPKPSKQPQTLNPQNP